MISSTKLYIHGKQEIIFQGNNTVLIFLRHITSTPPYPTFSRHYSILTHKIYTSISFIGYELCFYYCTKKTDPHEKTIQEDQQLDVMSSRVFKTRWNRLLRLACCFIDLHEIKS